MTIIYELIETEYGQMIKATTKDSNLEKWIPLDEANSDYQAYLKRDEATTI
jgi:hypothetical protein